MKPRRWPIARLDKNTARRVLQGHPWVWSSGVLPGRPGDPVLLQDSRNQCVGWGLRDDGDIAVRVLGRGEPESADLPGLVARRIAAADAARARVLPPNTDAYRVVSGAGDGLPGIIADRYGELVVLRIYSKAWERWLDDIVGALRRLPWAKVGWRKYGVRRVDGKTGGADLFGGPVPERLVVHEDGMKLLVRPEAGQKTGAFLDQREHRSLVKRWAHDLTVANLFAYNGGFSVSAALGGAKRVITVDLAPEAIEDAREIFRLNGIDPSAHGFEVADVFAWTPSRPQGLVIVDPPSLTRGKRSDDAARASYRKLHQSLAPHVTDNGWLCSASCTARLSLSDWREAVGEGLQTHGEWSWHWVSGEPPDHPTALMHAEARYLKFGLLRRR